MNIGKTLHAKDRTELRRWLDHHYKTTPDIWLVFYKKASGKAEIPYNDAVEEALCFGWIDSQIKTINSESYALRFSPRTAKSPHSPANKERLRALLAAGKVMPEVAAKLTYILDEKFTVAPDILAALKADQNAWRNFQHFSESYKRIRIAFIEDVRNRPKEFAKRLEYFVAKTAKNKQFGFGGIQKYY